MYKFFISILLIVLATSCGLKTFYIIDPPINADVPNPATGSIVTIPSQLDSFSFFARDLSKLLTFTNSGTDIYYRIYEDQADLQSDADRINDANDENTDNGYNQLISLGYKEMRSTRGGENPLIDTYGGRVTLQLDSLARPDISVSSISLGYTPLRSNGNFFNFDSTFAPDDDLYDIAVSNDDDFESGDNSGYHFVNLYAVSVGLESFSTQVQSEVLSLGFSAYSIK